MDSDQLHFIVTCNIYNKPFPPYFTEFQTLYENIVNSGNEIRQQFDFFDKDGSGKVSKSELKKALKELNEKISKTELKRMIKEADVDGDGEIDFDEFSKILSNV